MYRVHRDFKTYKKPKPGELEKLCRESVLRLEGLNAPIRIERIEIERLELAETEGLLAVRTYSKCGLEGIGISNKRLNYVYPILQKLIAPYLIGKDARRLEELLDEIYVYKNNYKLAGLAYYIALSAVETSLLDMLAKARQVSLGRLFGPARKSHVNLYVASGNRGNRAEEELEILAKRVEDTGAKAIKFKIGGRMSSNQDSLAGRSEALIYRTREYFGRDMIIHADGNGSYDAGTAIRFGRLLEEIQAYFYEEPCPFDDFEETKKVREALTIPLAFGEQETSMRRFRWLIENHGAGVLQPDILYNGGMIRTTKAAKMAAAANMTVTPHVSDGFGFVYILHASSYMENIGKYQECKEGFELANELLDGILEMKEGRITIPDAAGVGIRGDNPVMRRGKVVVRVGGGAE